MFELAVHGSVCTPAVHGRQLGVHRSGTPHWGSIYDLRRAVLHLVHTIYRGYDSGDGLVGKELQRTDSGSVRMWAADRQGAVKPVLVIGRGVERGSSAWIERLWPTPWRGRPPVGQLPTS